MPFVKGQSGNPKGRPKQSEEEKEDREAFKCLLRENTLSALENIIQIANDKYNRDRFHACQFIIDKAYGRHAAFFLDEEENGTAPIFIEVQTYRGTENE